MLQRFCSDLAVSWFDDVQAVYQGSCKQCATRLPTLPPARHWQHWRHSPRALPQRPFVVGIAVGVLRISGGRFELVVASSAISETFDETEQMVPSPFRVGLRRRPLSLPRVWAYHHSRPREHPQAIVSDLWTLTAPGGRLVLIEEGTPTGFDIVRLQLSPTGCNIVQRRTSRCYVAPCAAGVLQC